MQVAWWDKEAVTWFEGDNYHIDADDDIDRELIISFCIIIDDFTSKSHEDNTVTYDIGNFGLWAKKFDASWRPKYKI